MATEETQVLGYGRSPSDKGRRWFRWIIVLALLAGVGWAFAEFGSRLWRRIALPVIERRATGYVPAAAHIIIKGGPLHQAPFGQFDVKPRLDVPPAWTSYANGIGLESGPTLFVGQLKSPAGNVRTAVVHLSGDRLQTGYRGSNRGSVFFMFFESYVYTPASFWGGSRSATPPHTPFHLNLPIGKSFEVFAGRVDTADRGHVTIEYQNDSQRGTIDGWLLDDDNLRLVLRDGPAEQERYSRSVLER